MITVLQYLVIAAAIGLVVFFLAVLVFGRGEQMAPLPARTSPAELPGGAVSGDNIRAVRFAVGMRGYRMGDVDWTLDRMADEIDRLRAEIRTLGGDPDRIPEQQVGELLAVVAADGQPDQGPITAAPAAADTRTSGTTGAGEWDGPPWRAADPDAAATERLGDVAAIDVSDVSGEQRENRSPHPDGVGPDPDGTSADRDGTPTDLDGVPTQSFGTAADPDGSTTEPRTY